MKGFGYDTETNLIAPGRVAPKLICLTYQDLEDPEHKTRLLGNAEPGKLYDICRKLVVENTGTLAAHVASFDNAVLAEAYPELLPHIFRLLREGRIWDSKIVDKLAHISRGWAKFRPGEGATSFHLSDLAERYLNKEMTGKEGVDAWRFRYQELDGIPPKQWETEARNYPKQDTSILCDVVRAQEPYWDKFPTMELQHKADWALHLMGAWGARTDIDRVTELERTLITKVRDAMIELRAAGIYKPDGVKNMAKIQERVSEAYQRQRRKVPLTPGKSPKTDTTTLEESGDSLLVSLAEISSSSKLLSTFIPVLKMGNEGVVNPSYNVLVDSGRTSAYDPNVQQLPRKGGIRECFIPREGCVYVAADYHVAELCSLAQVLLKTVGWSKMADLLNAGRDLHIQTAASLLSISYDTAAARYAAGDPQLEETRQLSKAANFGYPGGLTPGGFVYYAKASGLEISFPQSTRVREVWMATYPEMPLYFDWINAHCNTGMGGRYQSHHPITGYIRGDVKFTEAANHHFQHLTAIGAKEALFEVAEECYIKSDSPLYGCRPIFFIHDEIIMEAPEYRAHEAAQRLTQVMEAGMSKWVKDVRCKADAAIMRRWYKGAKPVYDKDRRLVPWEPQLKV